MKITMQCMYVADIVIEEFIVYLSISEFALESRKQRRVAKIGGTAR